MRDFRPLFRLAMLASICSAGGSCVNLSGLHNGCAVTADCDPGRRCMTGICEPTTDIYEAADAGVDAEAGTDSSAPVDAPTWTEGGADAPADGGDGVTDRGSDLARDTGTSDGDGGIDAISPPPCSVDAAAGAQISGAILAQDILGTWRLCSSPTNLPSDIRWLLGEAGTIQLDDTHWWRLTVGQTSPDGQPAQGRYFRLMEGSGSVFHFVVSDVADGSGVEVAIRFLREMGALDLAACTGVGACGQAVARLVPVGGGSEP